MLLSVHVERFSDDLLQTDSSHKSDENWSQNLLFWLRNGLKLPCGKKKNDYWVFDMLLCIVGELAGVGSMAVGCGYWH